MNLAEIRKQGEIDALKDHIGSLRYKLTNSIWSGGYRAGSIYCSLGTKLDMAEGLIEEIRNALAELKKLEPENK